MVQVASGGGSVEIEKGGLHRVAVLVFFCSFLWGCVGLFWRGVFFGWVAGGVWGCVVVGLWVVLFGGGVRGLSLSYWGYGGALGAGVA